MALQTLNYSSSSSIIPNPTLHPIPIGKRSNNRRRPLDFVQEEYLAMCLVKLARVSPTVKYPTSLEQEKTVLKKSVQVEEKIDVKKDEEPTSLNLHTCNVCNRYFPSHQALNGHKGSHRAKEDENLKNVVKSSGVTCHKTFPTGQALGEGVIVSAKNRSSSDAKSTHSNDGTRVV